MANNQKSQCDVYPCVITNKTCDELWHGCDSASFGSGGKDGNTGCSSCCWMCFPFTVTADILCAIPFGIVWSVKKCKQPKKYPRATIQHL
jgi:hypothetical protein